MQKKRIILLTASLILLAIAVVAALELTNTTHFLHSDTAKNTPKVISQVDKKKIDAGVTGPKASGTVNKTPAGVTAPSAPDSPKSAGTANTFLRDPSGTFVSAHKNVPANAALSSVCNTTVGATCQIRFTSGTTTKSLDKRTTDSFGSAYWNSWTPVEIGLTPGTWQVTAVADLNGQTKASADALALEISQ